MFIVNIEGAIYKDGKWLIVRRSDKEDHAPGTLALVGGKVDQEGNTTDILERTLIREVEEEVGDRRLAWSFHLWSRREAKPPQEHEEKTMTPHSVAIIGTGLIGRAWAMIFARAGWDVALYDPAPGVAEAATGLCAQGLTDLALGTAAINRPV